MWCCIRQPKSYDISYLLNIKKNNNKENYENTTVTYSEVVA